MAAFWAVFIFGGSGPPNNRAAHGSLDLKQEIQILIKMHEQYHTSVGQNLVCYIKSRLKVGMEGRK
jgi:hypothetical protein